MGEIFSFYFEAIKLKTSFECSFFIGEIYFDSILLEIFYKDGSLTIEFDFFVL